MKTFKHFLEEAVNAIQSIRKSGFKLKKGGYSDPSLPDGMMRWGWQIKKAKVSDDDIDKLYKDKTNPKKPPDKPIDPYAIPVKKA